MPTLMTTVVLHLTQAKLKDPLHTNLALHNQKVSHLSLTTAVKLFRVVVLFWSLCSLSCAVHGLSLLLECHHSSRLHVVVDITVLVWMNMQ